MDKTTTHLKNTRFEDSLQLQAGERCFLEGQFEKALGHFIQFSEQSMNAKIFVSGRIAITLMKLGRFFEAKEFLKSILKASLMPSPEKERDYNCLYAECLYALGEIRQSEEVCFNIQKLHPKPNDELDALFRKVSIHPHLNILLNDSDWNGNKKSLLALERIIEILSYDSDKEEAAQYSYSLINCEGNYSVKPYLLLNDYYKEHGHFHYCLSLLEKLEQSMVPLTERNAAYDEILSVYQLSPCFIYSEYNSELKHQSALNPLEELVHEVRERAKQYSLKGLTHYLPELNLDNYFAREPQLAFA